MTTTTRARYQICPRCRADQRMGPVIKLSHVAVQCYYCGFRGPEIPVSERYTAELGAGAVDAWNKVERTPERQEEEELGQWRRWMLPLWFTASIILLGGSLRFLLLHAGDENASHVYVYAILVLIPVTAIWALYLRVPRNPRDEPEVIEKQWTWEDYLNLIPGGSSAETAAMWLALALFLFFVFGLR